MLMITADAHERASQVPSLLEVLGAQVDVRALTRGDYVVGPGTVVERKTVRDLHLSIMNGPFGSLRKVCEASIDELQTVPGVGIKRATAITALIHDPWNTPNAR
jgi:ERCC4-type nuclease